VKQLNRGLADLAEEGVVQVFKPVVGTPAVLGVVGSLQLDVLSSRLKQDYDVSIRIESAPYETARWLETSDSKSLERFIEAHRASVAEDKDGALVFLARNAWALNRAAEEWPQLTFASVRER
jgi:peptide chain release factor 3